MQFVFQLSKIVGFGTPRLESAFQLDSRDAAELAKTPEVLKEAVALFESRRKRREEGCPSWAAVPITFA